LLGEEEEMGVLTLDLVVEVELVEDLVK